MAEEYDLHWAVERIALLDKADVFYPYAQWPDLAKKWFTTKKLSHAQRGALLMFFINNGMSEENAYAVVATGLPWASQRGQLVLQAPVMYKYKSLVELKREAEEHARGKQGGRNRASQLMEFGKVWGYERVDDRGYRLGVWMKRSLEGPEFDTPL